MRTFFLEIIKTEKYLRHELTPEDSLVFQAQLLVDEELRINIFFHRMVHRLVCIYHRRKLKEKLEVVHERLFTDPAKATFREQITKIFNT